MKLAFVILVSVIGMKINLFTSIFGSVMFIMAEMCGVSSILRALVAVLSLGFERKY